MNKAQREVAEFLLNKEERIIKQLERQYKKALSDVEMDIRIMLMDEQTPSRIHRVEYQKRLKSQIEATLENLHRNEYKTINQFLQDSYTDAFVGAMYDMHSQGVPVIVPIDANAAVKAIQLDTQLSDRKIHPNANGEHVTLYESLGVDVNNLKETIRLEITRGLATNMQPEYIAQNIANLTKAPLSRAKTIARTESHRIQQSSAQDARERAKARGADVYKQWDSTLDGATRKAHRELDGQIVPINEPFRYGSLKAMYPGDFGDPAQDCNCRCVAVQRARWALDEEELQTIKERAEFFGLGKDEVKKQQFAEFEKKFLHAAAEESKANVADKSTVINPEVRQPAYRRLFSTLDESPQVQRTAYKEAIDMLEHRSGTEFEDLAFIDSATGKVLRRTDYNEPHKVLPSKRMMAMVRNSAPHTIISVHNHNGSNFPSMTDLHSAYTKQYKYGLIACHNGTVIKYKVTGEYNPLIVQTLLDSAQIIAYNGDGISSAKFRKKLEQLRDENVVMEVIGQ